MYPVGGVFSTIVYISGVPKFSSVIFIPLATFTNPSVPTV